MTGDATDDATDDATQRPALEPGMLRRARPDGYWARAFRRRPWATSAMVVLPIGVVVGVPLLAEAWVGVHLTGGAVILGWFTFSGLRTRVRATADAADEAEGADPGRPPVDVRGDAVVRPSFGPGTVTAARARDHTVTVLVLVGGPGAVTLAVAVAVVRRPFDLVLLGIAAALVGAALTAVVTTRLSLKRRTSAFLARALEPVPVRVVGMRSDGLSWVVETLDGGARSDVVLQAGDDLLVAGDVVRAWGDATPQAGTPPRQRRLALTGPFGTLWVSCFLDDRDVGGATAPRAAGRPPRPRGPTASSRSSSPEPVDCPTSVAPTAPSSAPAARHRRDEPEPCGAAAHRCLRRARPVRLPASTSTGRGTTSIVCTRGA